MENLVSISNFRIFIQLNLRVLIKHVLMVWMGCKKKNEFINTLHYTFWKHAVPIIHKTVSNHTLSSSSCVDVGGNEVFTHRSYFLIL